MRGLMGSITGAARPLIFGTAVIFVGCGQGAVAADAEGAQGLVGTWEGKLQAGSNELRLVFHFRIEDGELRATFDSPDQGATGIAFDRVALDGGKLTLAVDSAGASYEGSVATGRIQGRWLQGGGSFELDLTPFDHGDAQVKNAALEPLYGIWQGVLDGGPRKLRLVFHIESTDLGPAAKLDSPDEGLEDLPVDELLFDGEKLTLGMQALGARYEATFTNGMLDGQWHQRGVTLDLDLARTAEAAQLDRPQTPRPPFPYREERVSFPSRDGNAMLAGTLTLPAGGGPFPAAILITGSGLQDRDETILGHKPFLVIADYLARRGVAVLRYDDRGAFESTGDVANATLDDFAEDTLGAIALLTPRSDIDSIGLIGHSEGAAIADRVATVERSVRWTIRMAGAAVDGRSVLRTQGPAVLVANGASQAQARKLAEINDAVFALAVTDLDAATLRSRAIETIEEMAATLDSQSRTVLGLDDLQTAVGPLATPWFRHFLRHDPSADLARVQVPVLALFGDKDVQIVSSQNEPAARRALGNPDSETRVYPNVNHLFQTTTGTGSPSEYGAIVETLTPALLDDIVEWIGKHAA